MTNPDASRGEAIGTPHVLTKPIEGVAIDARTCTPLRTPAEVTNG